METTVETKSWAEWMGTSDEHEPTDTDAYEAFLKNEHKKLGDLIDEDTYLEKLEEFNNFYIGYFDTFEEFVEQDIRETNGHHIPEWLDRHIDWSSLANDYQCSGDYWHTTIGNWTHVFRTF